MEQSLQEALDHSHLYKFELTRRETEVRSLKQQLDETRSRMRELAALVEDQSGNRFFLSIAY